MPYIVQLGFFGEFVCWWSDKHLTSGQKDAKRFDTYKEAQQGTIDVYLTNQNRERDEPFWRKTDDVWRVIEVDSGIRTAAFLDH